MSDNHGNTPAAWSAVVVGLVGFIIGAVGLMFSPINWVIFWVGVVVTVAAGVVFVVMSAMGLNSSSEH